MKYILIIFTVLSFISKSQANSNCKDYESKKSFKNENEKFLTFLKTDWDQFMKLEPEWASDLGYKELAGVWSDDSLEGVAKSQNRVKCSQEILLKIKRNLLNPDNQVHFDLLKRKNQTYLDSIKFENHLMPLNQMSGVYSHIVDTLKDMPGQSAEDFENKLSRLRSANIKIQQHQLLLQEGLKKDLTPPKIVLRTVPSQIDGLLTKKVEDSPFYLGFKEVSTLSKVDADRIQLEAKRIISEVLNPELKKFHKFISETYLPSTRESLSVENLPMGKERYEHAIRYFTTTNLTAQEIHKLGLSEVDRILKEMNAVKTKAGYKKDLKSFNEFLAKESKFYFKKAEELVSEYRSLTKKLDAELPKLFSTLPRLTYGVREMEAFMAKAAPAAYYYPGSLEAGRPGFFVVNSFNLKARPKWGMPALAIHEAVPGHHLQIAISQELPSMPEFRKHGGYTAFSEGWALYAEQLGEEMGFYKDPYAKYGQLTYEMWRAIRLVVDTGLHSQSWTREQAIEYFQKHSAMNLQDITAEVDRYIVWPGQALAYKLGQLKISELRRRASEKLQDKFDIRKFHEFILGRGALPLDVLETYFETWLQTQAKS
jgi:prolyl oligopeptidase